MKSLKYIAAAAFASASVSAAPASATNTGVSDFVNDVCKPAVEAGYFDSVGECIGKGNQDVIAFCKELYKFIGFKNVGQCQSELRHFINDNDY